MKMNIKAMRNAHLYLGVFFAPLLAFFLISGAWQTFGLHENSDDGSYKAPTIIKEFSQVHKNQRWAQSDHDQTPQSSVPFQWLVVVMVVGLLTTTILGIIMAFSYAKGWLVWFCLLAGGALPCVLMWLACRG